MVQIRSSKKLKALLEMVLACGNFLNHETESRVCFLGLALSFRLLSNPVIDTIVDN